MTLSGRRSPSSGPHSTPSSVTGSATLLTANEVDATRRRLDALQRLDHFPAPDRGRRVIPWPPF